MKIAALLTCFAVFGLARVNTDLDCSIKIAVASMAALADVDYKQLKNDFYQCPALIDHIAAMDSKQEDLGFKFDQGGTREFINNLRVISKVAAEIQPIYLACDSIHKKDSAADLEGIARMSAIFDVFANPVQYNTYDLSVKAVNNWDEVEQAITKGLAEFKKDNCARCGMVMGKQLNKIMKDNSGMSDLIRNNAGKVLGKAKETLGKSGEKIANAAKDAMKNLGAMFGDL